MPVNISKYIGLVVLRAEYKADSRHDSSWNHIKYLEFGIYFAGNSDSIWVERPRIPGKILNLFRYEKSIFELACIFRAPTFRFIDSAD